MESLIDAMTAVDGSGGAGDGVVVVGRGANMMKEGEGLLTGEGVFDGKSGENRRWEQEDLVLIDWSVPEGSM